MAKDYAKLCPELSKHIDKAIIDADVVVVEAEAETKPDLTKQKVEDAYEMLKTDPQYLKIACVVGLDIDQVKELHEEFLAYKNWAEPVTEEEK